MTRKSPMTLSGEAPHPCGHCAFYQDSVWQPVEQSGVSTLARSFSRRELDEGEVLFEQGAESGGVYCVSRGLIALRSYQSDGKSTLLKLAYPGEIIGFRSFLDDGPHRTEARALVASRVCIVARRDAKRVVRANPSVLARLASRCIAEIDRSHERIIASATLSNKVRLTEILLQLARHHGARLEGYVEMKLPLSRPDLADLIGVQPETLSRLVKRLEREGEFLFSGRRVKIAETVFDEDGGFGPPIAKRA
ncbi:Crp/Fnr family transcriptional regulator [Shimia sp.]|uniref:Crp/Fnr family transcriptional regulator n=1 Tax=Shimia sp. TaxID=1954381 RepID=UPI00356715F1